MSELCVPLDYEQLPELWRLKRALAQHLTPHPVALPIAPPTPRRGEGDKCIEAAANFLFHRLFVTLGYLAQSTNQPGLLTDVGAQQLGASLEPMFGDDCDPVALLAECGLLQKPNPGMANDKPDAHVCPLFAKLNLHLSGDYKPGHIKGNINSRVAARMKSIPGEAMQQIKLLPEDVFQKRDGTAMTDVERHAAVVVIRTLDRCLTKGSRGKFEFSAGLMASAHHVAVTHDRELLKQFYFWLSNNYLRPEVAKTSDEILLSFDQHLALAKLSAPSL
jgi:hypothetical protein